MDRIPISAEVPSASIRAAQLVGLISSAYLAGTLGSISWLTMPAIMDAPAPLAARQWKKIFDTGKFVAPPLSIISAAIFGSLAYREPPGSQHFSLYTAAAVLVPSTIPYTLAFMGATNEKLDQKASSMAKDSLTDASVESAAAQGETVHELLDKWASLNFVRSLLPLVGTMAAGWALLDKYDVLGLGSISFKSGANRMG